MFYWGHGDVLTAQCGMGGCQVRLHVYHGQSTVGIFPGEPDGSVY